MILFIVSHIQVKYIWTTPHLIFKIFILCFVYTTSATTFLKKCLKTSFYQNIFTKFQQNKSSLSPSPPNWNGNHVIRYKWVCINFSDLLMSKITSHQYIIMPLKYFTSNFALAHICINLWLCPFWLSFLSVHS